MASVKFSFSPIPATRLLTPTLFLLIIQRDSKRWTQCCTSIFPELYKVSYVYGAVHHLDS